MREMRKKGRQLPEEEALEIFDRAPFVTVAMVRADGTPYALPLSLVRKDNRTFYFHCAFEGEKVDVIRANPVVSLSAVSKCTPKFEEDKKNFTEYYRSAIALGHCEEVTGREEKIEALRLLCLRFLPEYMDKFDDAISRSLERTMVMKITLTEPAVGKSKGFR